jgi:hypothetical protein
MAPIRGDEDFDEWMKRIEKEAMHSRCKEGKRHFSTMEKLEKCAESECPVCAVMLQGVREWAGSRPIPKNASTILEAYKHNGTVPRFISIHWSDEMADLMTDPYAHLVMYTLPSTYPTHLAF